jgi:hypothetical protein
LRPNPAEEQIQRLVSERLVGREVDGVTFVDELLVIAQQVGEVRCSPATDHGLRFQLGDRAPFEVDLDRHRGKLRMLCARLAVLCHESGDECKLYGGEGTIRKTRILDRSESADQSDPRSLSWKARWSNTPERQEFTLQCE